MIRFAEYWRKVHQEVRNTVWSDYRQTAVVFCILSVVFFVIGLSLVFHNDKIILLEIPLIAGVIIYAVVSTIRINSTFRR